MSVEPLSRVQNDAGNGHVFEQALETQNFPSLHNIARGWNAPHLPTQDTEAGTSVPSTLDYNIIMGGGFFTGADASQRASSESDRSIMVTTPENAVPNPYRQGLVGVAQGVGIGLGAAALYFRNPLMEKIVTLVKGALGVR
jgi:hypothetical protein